MRQNLMCTPNIYLLYAVSIKFQFSLFFTNFTFLLPKAHKFYHVVETSREINTELENAFIIHFLNV